jgi:hypothetical protein
MNYTSFVASLANLMAEDPAQPEFQLFIPDCITYAEKRIYREMDLIDTVCVSVGTLTAGDRFFALPPAAYGAFITVQGINVVTPTDRVVLTPVSVTFLNSVWGTPTGATMPQYFSMLQQDNVIVGPWPDEDYGVEIFGTYRPQPLSPGNQTTYLTTYLPDVFLAAAMVYASGYMRDFGSQSDNPAQAQSWENQYQTLMKAANLESLRMKFAGPGWTSLSSIPITPVR